MNDTDHSASRSSTPGGEDIAAAVAEMAQKTQKAKKTTDSLGSIPSSVYQALPDTIGDVARELDEGHDRDVFLTGLLPVLAGALPNAQFWYGGQWLSLNLYTAVVAPAGTGKGKMKHARSIGNPLNKHLHEQSRRRHAEWTRRKSEDSTEEPGPEPPFRRFFLAADSSAASMKENLEDCPHGVVFETEFKTLSTALGREWGQFRDVMLKGFQNEAVEVDRKSEEPLLINHPAPSMAVSGTPGTFSEVIGTIEDGLFSRFAFYRFSAEREWKSQFGDTGAAALEDAKGRAADCLKGMYRAQETREEPVSVRFSSKIKRLVNNTFGFILSRWKAKGVNRTLYASLKRAAVRALRIAAIIHLVRRHEGQNQAENIESVGISGHSVDVEHKDSKVEVGMQDAVVGVQIALTFLTNTLRIAEEDMEESVFGPPSPARSDLNRRQRSYLDALPDGEFKTGEAKDIAKELDIPWSTAKNWLARPFKENGLLEDVDHGVWRKPPDASPAKRGPGGHAYLSGLFGLLDVNPGLLVNPVSYSGDGAPSDQDPSPPEKPS